MYYFYTLWHSQWWFLLVINLSFDNFIHVCNACWLVSCSAHLPTNPHLLYIFPTSLSLPHPCLFILLCNTVSLTRVMCVTMGVELSTEACVQWQIHNGRPCLFLSQNLSITNISGGSGRAPRDPPIHDWLIAGRVLCEPHAAKYNFKLIITMLCQEMWEFLPIFSNLHLLVLIMCVGLYMWVQVPAEDRKGHQILWGWS